MSDTYVSSAPKYKQFKYILPTRTYLIIFQWNPIRLDKPITVPAQGLNICFNVFHSTLRSSTCFQCTSTLCRTRLALFSIQIGQSNYIWNPLPLKVTSCATIQTYTFKKQLQTHLLTSVFPSSWIDSFIMVVLDFMHAYKYMLSLLIILVLFNYGFIQYLFQYFFYYNYSYLVFVCAGEKIDWLGFFNVREIEYNCWNNELTSDNCIADGWITNTVLYVREIWRARQNIYMSDMCRK